MNDPTQGALVIRPKQDAYEHAEGGSSTSIVSAFPQKVWFDEKEGYLMEFADCKYPIPGLLDPIALMSGDRIKKYIKTLLKVLSTPPFLFSSAIAAILPMRKFREQTITNFAEFCHMESKEFILKLDKYTRAVREIRRALEVVNEQFNGGESGLWIIKAFAMTLENDRPYRNRLQDVLPEIDKQKLNQNPAKEIKRIIDLIASRDHAREWKKMGTLIWLAVKLRPEMRRFAVAFINELNLDLLRMDVKDRYWCYLHDGYDWAGLSKEERVTIHETL